MKDDPREVGWAEKKIKALERKVEELAAAVFSDDGDNRITEAHRRISAEAIRMNELRSRPEDETSCRGVDRLNRQVDRLMKTEAITQELVSNLVIRVDGHESRIAWLQTASTEAQQEMERRLDELENAEIVMSVTDWKALLDRISALETALENYGVPTPRAKTPRADDLINGESTPQWGAVWSGGASTRVAHQYSVQQDALREASVKHITGVQAMGKEQYERGLSAGAEAALVRAMRRVQLVLIRMGWAPDSPVMKTVLGAIEGASDLPN